MLQINNENYINLNFNGISVSDINTNTNINNDTDIDNDSEIPAEERALYGSFTASYTNGVIYLGINLNNTDEITITAIKNDFNDFFDSVINTINNMNNNNE